MNSKELFYLVTAALGGYAAYLTIKKHQQAQASSDWLTAGAFAGDTYDYYGSVSPVDNMDYLVNLDNQQPESVLSLLGFS